ncbi:MAG: hypothetical protein LR008_02790 [Candidatus Pacebacteria bacterium]|nr:hypothetical protein [Candidatus Paceibacterota bacterium]
MADIESPLTLEQARNLVANHPLSSFVISDHSIEFHHPEKETNVKHIFQFYNADMKNGRVNRVIRINREHKIGNIAAIVVVYENFEQKLIDYKTNEEIWSFLYHAVKAADVLHQLYADKNMLVQITPESYGILYSHPEWSDYCGLRKSEGFDLKVIKRSDYYEVFFSRIISD